MVKNRIQTVNLKIGKWSWLLSPSTPKKQINKKDFRNKLQIKTCQMKKPYCHCVY